MPLPPGLAGYHVGRQQQGQEQARQIHSLSALQNMMAQQQQMQQSEQVRGILSQAPSLEAAIPMLMKAGPAGIQAAGSLAQLQKQTADAKASSEKAAFFSPENTQQYRDGGQPGHPDITLPPELSGPVAPARAAVPGKMNFDRLLQDAASRNMVQPETYANHLAQREQAKASMEQTAQSRRDTLSTQLQIARERSEDQSLSRAENNKARMDMIRLTASLRAPPHPQPVTIGRVQDPENPERMIEVDARTYRGGSLGSPGVIGLSGKEGDAQKRENKRQFSMQGIGAAITQAEALLTDKAKPPTGSGLGAAVDYAGSLVGYSPGGAIEAQKLKAVGGALVSKVPRMEGPQSDKDLTLYKEMAGMVGDATVPTDRRIAALDTVKLLWEKYERLNPGTFSDRRGGDEPPPGAVRRK